MKRTLTVAVDIATMTCMGSAVACAFMFTSVGFVKGKQKSLHTVLFRLGVNIYSYSIPHVASPVTRSAAP